MQKIMIIVGAVIALTLSTLTAGAATLTNIQGDVKVNKGNGYQAARGSVNLNPGDKVLVGQNGTANIVYANGTSLPLGSGVTSVTSAVGGAAAATGGALGLSTTALVAGGVAVAAGVAVAVVASQKDDAPASP